MNQLTVLRRSPSTPADAAQAGDTGAGFAQAVLDGLAARPRAIPARYFYDAAGSALFEAITALPDYYPTRTETALLAAAAAEIGAIVGPGRAVVEFGAGSATKTPLLLAAIAPSAYIPIDISGSFLHEAAEALAARHPGLPVLPVVGDFTQPLALPEQARRAERLGFFPGSTIGNSTHAGAIDLLRRLRATLGTQSWLLIGMDTRKDTATLLPAYDDDAGITAAFNRNLLVRINRELDGDIPLAAFQHEAIWNDPIGRIEMHLRATQDCSFNVLGRRFTIAAGETIHTENSYKYTDDEARMMALASHWQPVARWHDDAKLFGLHLWRAAPEGIDP